MPLTIDPVGGGFVLGKTDGAFEPSADATVHGLWGYQPFEGRRSDWWRPRAARGAWRTTPR
ncbi:hypothetical protein [Sphingomonas melonis]|uniref:hypothetical protein n=1 Tax=Sphingomonas melonis TaxID=152682 RepID=UPI001F2454C3|nr:hypothetical protein [Sphingomonas melonis]